MQGRRRKWNKRMDHGYRFNVGQSRFANKGRAPGCFGQSQAQRDRTDSVKGS